MSATLIALDGPLQGEVFPVGDVECSVGRDPGNTIQIPEAAVSRRHCTIRSQADGVFRLTDLASRNGTMRNGFPVTECLLHSIFFSSLGEKRTGKQFGLVHCTPTVRARSLDPRRPLRVMGNRRSAALL